MRSGSIPLSEIVGGFDLQSTVESGQSFLWRRVNGETYEATTPHGGDGWYYTVTDGDVIFARQRSDRLEWRATGDAVGTLRRRLRLDDDLDAIFDGYPDDPALADARRAYPGLRVVRDPFFPCLVSFICSARTSVERIHELQRNLARAFGDAVKADGATYRAYPRADQLAAASEADLRRLGLGFRAPYVERAAATVASDDFSEADLRGESYEAARETLQSFSGVGPKIADCVALFALGHLRSVPIDRWTRRLVEHYYPEDARGSYGATAAAFRERFGERAGYAQTYLYHYVRSSGIED